MGCLGDAGVVTSGNRARLVALALVAVTASGCNLIFSDDYKFRGLWLANETGSAVLVDRGPNWRFSVEAGSTAHLWDERSSFPAGLTILTQACDEIGRTDEMVTRDTLVRVTSVGLEIVTDDALIPMDAEIAPPLEEWPCR